MRSIRADAWTDFELQVLYDVVNDVNWFEKARALIDRSDNAVRVKMSALRAEAGIIPGIRGPRAMSRPRVVRDDAAAGSRALLLAIAAAQIPPARRPASEPPAEVQLAMFDGPLFDWQRPLELAA